MATKRGLFALLLALVCGLAPAGAKDELSGKLIIFHAGSLAVPFQRIAAQFKARHPQVELQLEAAGSRDCARKVSDLRRPCDVLAAADYLVIDQLLIPEHASWNLKFATNEMTLVYRPGSRRAQELTAANWFTILADPKVAFGRADPNADPCGYRTVLTLRLAEKQYAQPGLAAALLRKDTNFIRPKETDLLALLEAGAIDYIFLYRSVAEQHQLPYLRLPDEINLKNPACAELYRAATVELSGKKPGETVIQRGEPMVYGVTIPKTAPNRAAAVAFVQFLLTRDQGLAVIEQLGQPACVPAPCPNWDQLPPELQPFALQPP